MSWNFERLADYGKSLESWVSYDMLQYLLKKYGQKNDTG
jgi:hypothetical protein